MDIYFEESYGALYENVQHGILRRFAYNTDYGRVLHQFIQRPIEIDLLDGNKYFDLITPYGYGGPVILECHGDNKKILEEGFCRAFTKYCQEKNIVSEYITFHPVLKNAQDFMGMYQPVFTRRTLGTTLSFDDPVAEEFSKSCRKNLYRYLRQGVSFRITPSPPSLEGFMDIYYDTMNHKHASEFYYFDKQYFCEMHETMRDKIVLAEALYEGKVIASEINLIGEPGGMIHGHLTGVLSEYRYLSPQYVLCYGLTLWGQEHGYSLIHRGGGLSADETDPLFVFKRKFSQKTCFELYTSKKVWNQDVYDRICKAAGVDCNKVNFFPAYRAALK